MREALRAIYEAEQAGQPTGAYTGKVGRYGLGAPGALQKYVVLEKVLAAGGEEVTDHVWMPLTEELSPYEPGSNITFKASVAPYAKGRKRMLDYGFNRPHSIHKMAEWLEDHTGPSKPKPAYCDGCDRLKKDCICDAHGMTGKVAAEPARSPTRSDWKNAPGVRAVVVNDEGKVLLLRRPNHEEFHPGKWNLPGGAADKGEKLLTGAHRELREETGLTATPTGHAHDFKWPGGKGKAFLMTDHAGKLRLAKDEVAQAKWFDPDKLPKKLFPNTAETVEALSKHAQEEPMRPYDIYMAKQADEAGPDIKVLGREDLGAHYGLQTSGYIPIDTVKGEDGHVSHLVYAHRHHYNAAQALRHREPARYRSILHAAITPPAVTPDPLPAQLPPL